MNLRRGPVTVCALFVFAFLSIPVYGVQSEPATSDSAGSGLTFERRVACQWAIEEVYWSRRIWPESNPGRKPGLREVMTQSQIESKVEDYLKKSSALESIWSQPITSSDLQAEIDRLTRDSHAPDVLREISDALEGDGFLIAECLARPLLADRRLREVYAQSPSSGRTEQGGPALSFERWWEGESPRVSRQFDAPSASYSVSSQGVGACNGEGWLPISATNAPGPGSGFVMLWTGAEVFFHGGFDSSTRKGTDSGALYDPATDSWKAIATTGGPGVRWNHLAVWTGTEAVLWGGLDGNSTVVAGSRYSPSTNSWKPVTSTGGQSVVQALLSTAVWSGSEMLVVESGNAPSGRNARYSPTSDSWKPMSTTGAPASAGGHTAVWARERGEMIVWGGGGSGQTMTNEGARYNPGLDTWVRITTTGAPEARFGHVAVWSGSEMIVWGGSSTGTSFLNTGGRYDPAKDSWAALPTIGAPAGKAETASAWTGTDLIVYGRAGGSAGADGGRYRPSTDSWAALPKAGAPEVGYYPQAVWTGTQVIFWGEGPAPGGQYCPGAGGTPACTIDCSASVVSLSGSTVSFQASATPANCTGTALYSWNFGDGQTSTSRNPIHTYAASGVFSWSMTVTFNGVPCTRQGTVLIATGPCTLACSASVPATGVAGVPISFAVAPTTKNCPGEVSYLWYFGEAGAWDSDPVPSTLKDPSHAYVFPGTYGWSVHASVGGATCTKTGAITIGSTCLGVPVPKLLFPIDGSLVANAGEVQLNWTSSGQGFGYEYEISDDDQFQKVEASGKNGPDANGARFAAMTPGSRYYWRVRYTNTSCAAAPWSGTRSFVTLPAGVKLELRDAKMTKSNAIPTSWDQNEEVEGGEFVHVALQIENKGNTDFPGGTVVLKVSAVDVKDDKPDTFAFGYHRDATRLYFDGMAHVYKIATPIPAGRYLAVVLPEQVVFKDHPAFTDKSYVELQDGAEKPISGTLATSSKEKDLSVTFNTRARENCALELVGLALTPFKVAKFVWGNLKAGWDLGELVADIVAGNNHLAARNAKLMTAEFALDALTAGLEMAPLADEVFNELKNEFGGSGGCATYFSNNVEYGFVWGRLAFEFLPALAQLPRVAGRGVNSSPSSQLFIRTDGQASRLEVAEKGTSNHWSVVNGTYQGSTGSSAWGTRVENAGTFLTLPDNCGIYDIYMEAGSTCYQLETISGCSETASSTQQRPPSAITDAVAATIRFSRYKVNLSAGDKVRLVSEGGKGGTLEIDRKGDGTIEEGVEPEISTFTDGQPPKSVLLAKSSVEVTVSYRNQYTGETGQATPLPQGDGFAFFHFSSPSNPEVFVKVLDFGAASPYLLFYAGLTDFEYTVTYRNVGTGKSISMTKPAGSFAGGASNNALPHGAVRAIAWSRDGESWANVTTGESQPLWLGGSGAEEPNGHTPEIPGFTVVEAQPGATTSSLLLQQGRVAVTVSYRNQYTGQTGAAIALPQKDEFGFFYFSSAENPEVFVKVLDFGRNRPFLIFLAGLTDFEYTVTFQNVETGQTVSYKKDAGSFNGWADNLSLRPVECTIAEAPRIRLEPGDAGRVDVSWSRVPNAGSYTLLRDGAPIYTGGDVTFRDSSLAATSRYCYTVRATNACHSGPLSSQVCKETCAVVAAGPQVQATALSEDAISVSWTAVPGATAYVLSRDGLTLYSGPATSFKDEFHERGSANCYILTTRNDCGERTQSNQTCVTAGTPNDPGCELQWTVSSSTLYPNRLAVVTDGKSFVATTGDALLTSSDGINWTRTQTATVPAGRLAFGAGKFLGLTNSKIISSSDGKSWQSGTLPFVALNGFELACLARSCIASRPGSDYYVSTDGTHWSQGSRDVYDLRSGSWGAARAVGDQFIAIRSGYPYNYGTMAVSNNGQFWISKSTGELEFISLTWDGSRYLGMTASKLYSSLDLSSWVEIGSFSGLLRYSEGLESVSLVKGRIVVRTNERLVASSDGRTWTLVGSSNIVALQETSSKIYAFESSGEVGVSSDLAGWSWAKILLSPKLNSIAYGNGVFVAVGEAGRTLVSPDGVLWERVVSGLYGNLRRVIYHQGLFVAAGERGLATSPDGRAWQSKLPDASLGDVIWDGKRYLAVPWDRSGKIWTSADGETWRSFTTPAGNFVQIAGVPGKYVAVFLASSSPSYTEDFQTWKWGDCAAYHAVAFDGTRFFVSGNSGFCSTVDGVSWQRQETPNLTCTRMTYQPDGFYAACNLYSAADKDPKGGIYRSRDGSKWELTVPATKDVMPMDVYSGTKKVVVGSGIQVGDSFDSLTRLTAEDSGKFGASSGAAVGNGHWVVLSENTVLLSDDGLHWTQSTKRIADSQLRALAFGKGRFVAVGDLGTILTSTDGVSWLASPSPTSKSLVALAHGAPGFVATGERGETFFSPDGLSWLAANVTLPESVWGIVSPVFAGDQFLSFGMSSRNGLDWMPYTLNFSPCSYYASAFAAYRSKRLVFVCNGAASHDQSLLGIADPAGGQIQWQDLLATNDGDCVRNPGGQFLFSSESRLFLNLSNLSGEAKNLSEFRCLPQNADFTTILNDKGLFVAISPKGLYVASCPP